MTAADTLGAPATAARGKGREPRLEGLRGFCALGVLIFHVAYSAGVTNQAGEPSHGFWGFVTSGLSVCLPPFFVLSGMFLYRSFARAILTGTRRPATLPFLWGRALRIIPAYWALTAVAVLAVNLPRMNSAWDVLKPFVLMHFLFTRDPSQWLVGMDPTWTIPTEVFFYLTLPVIAWLINGYARRATDEARRLRRMLVPLSTLVVVGLGWVTFSFLPSMAASTWYYYFWPFSYVGFFALGMMLATLSAHAEVTGRMPALYRLAARRPNLFWLGALLVFVINVPTPFGEPGEGTWGALAQELVQQVLLFVFALLIMLPLAAPRADSRLIRVALTNRPILYIGRISFGVYLWHELFIQTWFKNGNILGNDPVPGWMFRGTVGFWELLAYTLVLTIATATVSYYALERPARNLRSRRSATAGAPAVTPIAAPVPAADERAA